MAVYRVDIFTADPDPVRRWIDDNVPAENVVRTKVLTKPNVGSNFAAVFTRKEYADAFKRHWATRSADDLAAAPDKWNAWAARQEEASRTDEPTNRT
jgi:hypothetical protein